MLIGKHRQQPPAWQPAAPKVKPRSQDVELGNHRVVVFSGHGSLNTITDASRLQFRVPLGTTIVFWVAHGQPLDDAIGTRIDRRWSLQDLPKNTGSALEIVKGGQLCYNYRLTPPRGLTLGNDPAKDPRFIINPKPVTSTEHISVRGLLLADLLQLPACKNAIVHWAACRSIIAR
jgi:hypothetical protein